MGLIEITRHLYPDEIALLKKNKAKAQKDLKQKVKIHYVIIAILLGIGLSYLVPVFHSKFWAFIFGTLAILCFAFAVLGPYEYYKDLKKLKSRIREIDNFLDSNQLKTIPVEALRIAIAKEYEDEGDLIIIEYQTNNILFLWDYDYNLGKKFPCLKFEIYNDTFFRLVEKQVCALSEKVPPIYIDKKLKWAYMKKYGCPGHLTTEQINLDDLMDKFYA